jgi:hypothetical protein
MMISSSQEKRAKEVATEETEAAIEVVVVATEEGTDPNTKVKRKATRNQEEEVTTEEEVATDLNKKEIRKMARNQEEEDTIEEEVVTELSKKVNRKVTRSKEEVVTIEEEVATELSKKVMKKVAKKNQEEEVTIEVVEAEVPKVVLITDLRLLLRLREKNTQQLLKKRTRSNTTMATEACTMATKANPEKNITPTTESTELEEAEESRSKVSARVTGAETKPWSTKRRATLIQSTLLDKKGRKSRKK